MSRSRKKTPIFPVCTHNHNAMKKWKKVCNQSIRRVDMDDIGNGNSYRKVNSIWSSPSDGKFYNDTDDFKKYLRK